MRYQASTFLRRVKKRREKLESFDGGGRGGSGGPVFRRKSASALVSVCRSETEGRPYMESVLRSELDLVV